MNYTSVLIWKPVAPFNPLNAELDKRGPRHVFQTTDPHASIPRFSRVGKKFPTRRGGEPVLSPPRASEHLSGSPTEARKSCPCAEGEALSNGQRSSGRTKRTPIPHAKERQRRRSPQRRAHTRRHTQKGRAGERP